VTSFSWWRSHAHRTARESLPHRRPGALRRLQKARPSHWLNPFLSCRRGPPVLEYDPEWLAIVRAAHPLLSKSNNRVALPQESRLVSEEDKAW
jgi:hypothetical protein